MSKTLVVMLMFVTCPNNIDIADFVLGMNFSVLEGRKHPNISVPAVDPGAMGGPDLIGESPATWRFDLNWVMAPLAKVATAPSPNRNFRSLLKSAKHFYMQVSKKKPFGKDPKAVISVGVPKWNIAKK